MKLTMKPKQCVDLTQHNRVSVDTLKACIIIFEVSHRNETGRAELAQDSHCKSAKSVKVTRRIADMDHFVPEHGMRLAGSMRLC